MIFLLLGCHQTQSLEATIYYDLDRSTQESSTVSDEGQSNRYALIHEETIEVDGAQIWNGIVDGDGFFYFFAMSNDQLSKRTYDYDLNPISDFDPITSTDDYPEGNRIADHAVLAFGDQFYLLFSGNSDNLLSLFSCKANGQRTGFFQIQEGGDIPANDPHLVSDGERICARWGKSGYDKRVQCFDPDLNPLTEIIHIETPSPVPQLGTTIFHNNEYWSFTGAASQRDLIYTRYDSNWNPLSPFEVTILRSENFEWNWFPSGVARIKEKGLWIIAYTNMHADAWEDARARLAVFNDAFEILDMHEISVQSTYRPHVMVSGDSVFVSFDAGPVVLQKWTLTESVE